MLRLLRPFAWTSKSLFNKGFKYGLFALASSLIVYEGTRAGGRLFSSLGGKKLLRSRNIISRDNVSNTSRPHKRSSARIKNVRRKVA